MMHRLTIPDLQSRRLEIGHWKTTFKAGMCFRMSRYVAWIWSLFPIRRNPKGGGGQVGGYRNPKSGLHSAKRLRPCHRTDALAMMARL